MSSIAVTLTHLLDAAGNRLCRAHAGPSTPLPALLQDTCAAGVTFCPGCTRFALAYIVELAQARCGADPLLDAIFALMLTPPDHAAAVVHIINPALVELDDYVEQVVGHHD